MLLSQDDLILGRFMPIGDRLGGTYATYIARDCSNNQAPELCVIRLIPASKCIDTKDNLRTLFNKLRKVKDLLSVKFHLPNVLLTQQVIVRCMEHQLIVTPMYFFNFYDFTVGIRPSRPLVTTFAKNLLSAIRKLHEMKYVHGSVKPRFIGFPSPSFADCIVSFTPTESHIWPLHMIETRDLNYPVFDDDDRKDHPASYQQDMESVCYLLAFAIYGELPDCCRTEKFDFDDFCNTLPPLVPRFRRFCRIVDTAIFCPMVFDTLFELLDDMATDRPSDFPIYQTRECVPSPSLTDSAYSSSPDCNESVNSASESDSSYEYSPDRDVPTYVPDLHISNGLEAAYLRSARFFRAYMFWDNDQLHSLEKKHFGGDSVIEHALTCLHDADYDFSIALLYFMSLNVKNSAQLSLESLNRAINLKIHKQDLKPIASHGSFRTPLEPQKLKEPMDEQQLQWRLHVSAMWLSRLSDEDQGEKRKSRKPARKPVHSQQCAFCENHTYVTTYENVFNIACLLCGNFLDWALVVLKQESSKCPLPRFLGFDARGAAEFHSLYLPGDEPLPGLRRRSKSLSRL